MENPDNLSTTLGALADPTRRAILARLAGGEATVTQLAEPFEMSLPAISRHLKVLERAKLITRGREAQWRPCKLAPEPLKEVADYMNSYRRFWDESLDQLEAYLVEVQAPAEKKKKKKKKKRKDKERKRRKRAENEGRHSADPKTPSNEDGR